MWQLKNWYDMDEDITAREQLILSEDLLPIDDFW
jgi:hypothetical protein